MGSSRVVRAVLVGVALGAAFAACAKGTQIDTGGGMGGAGTTTMGHGGTGGMPEAGPTGTIGSPCPDGVCAMGTCTLVGNTKYCTTACPPTCPEGTYCSIIGGNPICVPDLGQQCQKCMTSTDCKLPSDNCLTAPPGDTFCARDCTVDGMCPNGFVCEDMGSYESDGGAADGGGTGGGDAGLPSAPARWCVPDSGASCPCNPGRDGVTNTCDVTNTLGTCTGMETCSGATSTWMGCTAMTPMMEICNGMDDNCNGMVDEGNPNMLCASVGAQPPNANWACVNGVCQLGTCLPGWAAYPSGNAMTGCGCQVDADEPNQNCSTATAVGMVVDVGGAPIVISGTLSSDTDVNVYAFSTLDTPENGTNSYHVSIAFVQPSPNNEFVMDVIRSGICSDAPPAAPPTSPPTTGA